MELLNFIPNMSTALKMMWYKMKMKKIMVVVEVVIVVVVVVVVVIMIGGYVCSFW